MYACIFLCKILIKTIAPQDFRFFATSGFEFNCITFYVGSLTKVTVNARKNVGSTSVFLLSKPFLLLRIHFSNFIHYLIYGKSLKPIKALSLRLLLWLRSSFTIFNFTEQILYNCNYLDKMYLKQDMFHKKRGSTQGLFYSEKCYTVTCAFVEEILKTINIYTLLGGKKNKVILLRVCSYSRYINSNTLQYCIL